MGYRANVITQGREYGSTTFCDWESFTSDFIPALEELGYEVNGNDAEDLFEIEKDKLQEFVNTLPNDEEQSISPEYNNKDLKSELQRAINEAPKDSEWVSWEWF